MISSFCTIEFGIACCFLNVVQEQLPFAVVGSDRYVTVSGKPVLGRKTKWGLVEGNVLSTSSCYSLSPFFMLVVEIYLTVCPVMTNGLRMLQIKVKKKQITQQAGCL